MVDFGEYKEQLNEISEVWNESENIIEMIMSKKKDFIQANTGITLRFINQDLIEDYSSH